MYTSTPRPRRRRHARSANLVLSSFLPGQEAGNVPFVEGAGFGVCVTRPTAIAATVADWLQDEALCERMRSAALAGSRRRGPRPEATRSIAVELLGMCDGGGSR
jgi:1,2-diacylglycerol 3-beta-galactosyltransferase